MLGFGKEIGSFFNTPFTHKAGWYKLLIQTSTGQSHNNFVDVVLQMQ